MTLFHFHVANPTVLRLTPITFKEVSGLGDEFPWDKAGLLAHGYMHKEDCYDIVGGICYSTMEKETLHNVIAKQALLVEAEKFLTHHLHGCQRESQTHGFLKCVATLLAKSGQLLFEAGAGKCVSLEEAKFAKVEGKFISQVLSTGVVKLPYFEGTRDELEESTPNADSIIQAPRLAFQDDGVLVRDIKYQRGVDGIVEGAKVVVVGAVEANSKRRKVVSEESGVIIRVHNNTQVTVEFGKEGVKDEVPMPIS